jgi:hypothetical protein
LIFYTPILASIYNLLAARQSLHHNVKNIKNEFVHIQTNQSNFTTNLLYTMFSRSWYMRYFHENVVSVLSEAAYHRQQAWFPWSAYIENQEEYDSVLYFNSDYFNTGTRGDLQYSVCRQCGNFYPETHSCARDDEDSLTRRSYEGSSTIVSSQGALCDCVFYLGIYYWVKCEDEDPLIVDRCYKGILLS